MKKIDKKNYDKNNNEIIYFNYVALICSKFS